MFYSLHNAVMNRTKLLILDQDAKPKKMVLQGMFRQFSYEFFSSLKCSTLVLQTLFDREPLCCRVLHKTFKSSQTPTGFLRGSSDSKGFLPTVGF